MNEASAISLHRVSKTYRLWNSPEARLQAALWAAVGRKGRAETLYRDFHALAELNLEIPRGQSLGIIGLNGSGKSTLLQLIAGTLQPSTGEVKISGRLAALLELGAGFNPDFSGRDNVYLNAAVLGLTREEVDARFSAIAAFADIGDFIDQPVKTYSSGMYIRLAFAVLTQVEPEILIIDEALAVGDFLFQQKCYDRIREFRHSGCTFLFVSHGMGTVLELCDRVIVLDRGRLLFDGPAPKAVAVFEENAVRARYGGTAAAPKTRPSALAERHGGAGEFRPPSYALVPNVDLNQLRQEPGSIHSPKVSLLFARFLDTSFEEKLLFPCGALMVISLGFRIHVPLAEPHIGFKLRDQLGRVIFETSSLCMRHRPEPVHEGEVFVGNFSVRLPLIPGEYSLVAGFSEGAIGDRDYREALFYVQHLKTFNIVADPADILWSGLCHLNPQFGWSILNEGTSR